jgi:hypothetical protein
VILPFRSGWLLLLDWAPGPRDGLLRTFFGLDGGLQASMPFFVVFRGVAAVVGEAVAGWLPALLFFPIGAAGIARLTRQSTVAQGGAALLFLVNPFVFERTFVGHFPFLLGVALLPHLLTSILDPANRRGWRAARPLLWWAAAGALAVHLLWIGGVIVVLSLLITRRPQFPLAHLIGGGVISALLCAYLIIPAVALRAQGLGGGSGLSAFRPLGDPRVGLAVNLAGLYGFWRPEPRLPKHVFSGWPVVLVAVLIVVVSGFVVGLRDPRRRSLTVVLAASGVIGLLLAMGDQGPTGMVYRGLFHYVPPFGVMREAQKFLALLLVAYAVLFGWGVDAIVRLEQGRRRAAVTALLLVLPVMYTPTELGGLAGQLRPSRYPNSWARAERIMGRNEGAVLALPWHAYLSFDFTRGRRIPYPAESYFSRPVLASDAVDLPGVAVAGSARSTQLVSLFSRNGGRDFAGSVVPLGVEYVLLAKTADWHSFGWLDGQPGLQRVLDTSDLALYRNERWHGTVYSPERAETSGRRLALTRFRVDRPGAAVLAEPFDSQWRASGGVRRGPAGAMLVRVTRRTSVRFGGWIWVAWGYSLSLGAAAVLVVCSSKARRSTSGTHQEA